MPSLVSVERSTGADPLMGDLEAPAVAAVVDNAEDQDHRQDHNQQQQLHANLIKHLSMTVGEDSPLLSKRLLQLPTSKSSTQHKRTPCGSSFQQAWKWYEGQIEKRPLLTKCITAGIIVGLGDLTSQCLGLLRLAKIETATTTASTTPGIDWYRSWTYCLLGLLIQAPISHYYYAKLDAALPPTPSPFSLTTLCKLSIDQLCFAPTFLVCIFLFLDTVQHGLSPTLMLRHLQSSYCSTLVANWKLWTPSTIVNFVLIKPQYRVLFCNAVFFVWSIILSMLLN